MSGKGEKEGKYCHAAKHVMAGLCLLFFFVMAAGLALPTKSSADEGWGPGQDRWKFQLGGYFPSINSDMQIEINDTDIDLEEKLGLDENDALWRVDGSWRFARKHRLKFGYYGFDREASKSLVEDLTIGDEVWYAGAFVKTDWTMDYYTLSYLYSFYQGEKWEIAGYLGAYWVRLKVALALAAALDRPPLGNLPPGGPEDLLIGDRVESESFEGPLPLLGLSFDYYITPKWMASFKAGYFQLSIDQFKGRLLNLGANIEYQFTRMFGLGLGYDSFNLNLEAEEKGSFAGVDYRYHGVQVYGILRF
jgi:hypothetical protein